MKTISGASFRGEYYFLSNFFPSRAELEGLTFPTVEHAFVAAKTESIVIRGRVQSIPTPGQAKRFGRTIRLRGDWEDVKLGIMEELIRKKFSLPELRNKLLATEGLKLEEINPWHDTYWGVYNGEGENHLGKILMKIRSEIQGGEHDYT